MSRHDLANVLLRLSGFLMAFRAVVFLPQSLISQSASLFTIHQSLRPHTWAQLAASVIGVILQVVAGAILVTRSSTLSTWLIRFGEANNEDAEP